MFLGPTFTLWKEAAAAAIAVVAVHWRRVHVNRARPGLVWFGPPSIDLVEFCRFVFIIGTKAVLPCS